MKIVSAPSPGENQPSKPKRPRRDPWASLAASLPTFSPFVDHEDLPGLGSVAQVNRVSGWLRTEGGSR